MRQRGKETEREKETKSSRDRKEIKYNMLLF